MAEFADRLRAALADRYAIERELGSGGMATVYLAQDLKHGRTVALKVLRPWAAVPGPERFLREIRIAAQLNHPHILPLFDSGETEGQLWYVMPLVEGESLRERLRREQQLPLEDALAITREVADALGFAHSRGIVHRDIKPENILLSGGHALVADFGIARALALEVGTLTDAGIAVGTPTYMSPEQASGDGVVDARSDLYALGCVLYEMLAGEPPYTGPSTQAILAKHIGDPVPSVRRLRGTVPAAVDEALSRVLAKAPADRFATDAQFVEALTQPAGRPLSVGHRGVWVAIAALVVLGVTVGVMLARGRRSGPSSAPSVIVAPFENRSADTLDNYLAATLTEDLSAVLSDAHAVRLISSRGDRRTADYLVSGSIGRTGDSISMTAALERAGSGEMVWTARHTWTRGRGISVADTLAAGVLRALGLREAAAGTSRQVAARPIDAEAYDLYLRARYQAGRRNQGNVVRSVALFSQAILRDSTFALAWAGLARSLEYANRRGFVLPGVPRDSLISREAVASQRALELDSTNVEAWLAFGLMLRSVDPADRSPSLRAFHRALALDSLSAEAWHQLGHALEESGDPAGAVRAWRRAVTLNPQHVEALAFLGGHYLWARKYDSVAVWADSAVVLDPAYILARDFAGTASLYRGRLAEAETQFSAARSLSSAADVVQPLRGLALVAVASGDRTRARALLAEAAAVTDSRAPALHSAVDLAGMCASLGDTAHALRWLEAYRIPRDLHFQLHLRMDPQLDPLRKLPRFQALLRKVP